MKITKILFILLGISSMTYAQYGGGRGRGTGGYASGMPSHTAHERPSAEEMAQNQTEMMSKKLDLNPDQYAKVSEINLRYNKSQEAFMNTVRDANDTPEIMMKRMKDFRVKNDYDKDNEFKAILDQNQFEAYQKTKKRGGLDGQSRGGNDRFMDMNNNSMGGRPNGRY